MTHKSQSNELASVNAQAQGSPGGAPSERFSAIGHCLCQEREAQGRSRADVARNLHLPVYLLDDLEAGRMERLPPVYRRGYINNYANLLGLDATDLTKDLKDDQPPQLTQIFPNRRPRFRFERYMKLTTYLVVTIAIVPPLVLVYLNTGVNLFHSDDDRSENTTETVMISAAENDSLENQELQSIPMTPPINRDPDDGLAGQDTELQDDAVQRPLASSTLPLPSMRARNSEATDQTNSDTAQPRDPQNVLEQSDQPSAPQSPEFELTVRLSADSWVEISAADDQRLEYDLLRANQEISYRGLPPFTILLGRASAVDLILDGELLTYDGHDRGDVAQFVINRDKEIQP